MDFKYPYTDFHELNLDWFMARFKELVEEWNSVREDWNSLHDYVQNYFENLNVQTEIDNKINEMIADGSFADILTPLVEAALPTIVDGKLPAVVAAQINAVVAAQIGAVVAGQISAPAAAAASAWLADHVDPSTGYVIDSSLTIDNAAANAKTVGDNLSTINDFINTNFITGSYTNTSDLFTAKPGYSASSAGWVPLAGYDSYYFTAAKTIKIYPAETTLPYYAITIYNNGEVSSANYVARYRQSDNNMPTVDNPLFISQGQVVVVTINTNTTFVLYSSDAPAYLGSGFMSQIDNEIAAHKNVKVTKNGNNYLITSNDITFDFRKTVDQNINQDCWRFVSVAKNGVSLVNGDIIGVILEANQSDFMGGVHGDEIIDHAVILGDGVPFSDGDTYCDNFEAYLFSHLYRPSDHTSNVIDRYVHLTINNGTLTVDNTFKCLIDNFVCVYAYNSGLIGMYKANMTTFSSNTEIADLSDMPGDFNDSHDNIWYFANINGVSIKIENLIGHENPDYHAYAHYFANESPQRIKVYMSSVRSATWNTGHICNGRFRIIFS